MENRRRREATCKHFGVILWLCRRHKQQNGTGIGNQRQHKQHKASESRKYNKMQGKCKENARKMQGKGVKLNLEKWKRSEGKVEEKGRSKSGPAKCARPSKGIIAFYCFICLNLPF